MRRGSGRGGRQRCRQSSRRATTHRKLTAWHEKHQGGMGDLEDHTIRNSITEETSNMTTSERRQQRTAVKQDEDDTTWHDGSQASSKESANYLSPCNDPTPRVGHGSSREQTDRRLSCLRSGLPFEVGQGEESQAVGETVRGARASHVQPTKGGEIFRRWGHSSRRSGTIFAGAVARGHAGRGLSSCGETVREASGKQKGAVRSGIGSLRPSAAAQGRRRMGTNNGS